MAARVSGWPLRAVKGLGVLAGACWMATASAEGVQKLDEVSITANPDNAVGVWDAASQGVVTREEIERRPLSRSGEVLETVPGMIVTQHSGDGKANQYFLRGYNLDHGTDFATWVAGMPVNQPTNAHGQGYTDLNFLIPELVTRVQYNKGPYFAEDGDFASVGSARISYAEKLPASLVSLTIGEYGYKRALLAGSPEVGAGRVVYGFEYGYSNGPWDNPEKFHKLNGVLRYAQGTAGNGFNVTAMGYSANWNSTDQIPLRAVQGGLIDRFGAVDPSDGGNTSRYSLSGEWRQTDGNVSRNANVYAIRSKLTLISNFTYFLDNPVQGDQFMQSENRTAFGAAASQTWAIKWADREVLNTLGVQLRRDRMSPVALYTTQGRQVTGVTTQDEATVTSMAPYFSNTIKWNDWLRTVAGLRFDRQQFDVTSMLAANSGNKSDSLRSPKFSAVFGPWAKTEYFLNWGRGFHSNDARGVNQTIDPKTGSAVTPVTPLARTTGYEVGVRTQYVPGMTTSIALWQLRQNSELLFVGDAGTTEPSRPSLRTGVEALVQYQARPWLAFDASAGITRSRFTDVEPPGNYVPNAPDAVVSAGVTVDNYNQWFGALRWRYFGPRPLIEDNSVSSAATSLVNARVGYAFDKRLRLQLDVFNLFNRQDHDIDYYYTSRLPGEAAAGVNDVHFHPVEPRSARLTLIANF
ncbi:MAG: TonB-dependent receptor [Betaproteobacteria bacterium]